MRRAAGFSGEPYEWEFVIAGLFFLLVAVPLFLLWGARGLVFLLWGVDGLVASFCGWTWPFCLPVEFATGALLEPHSSQQRAERCGVVRGDLRHALMDAKGHPERPPLPESS